VVFLNETGGGVIISITNSNQVIVLNEEGFEETYPANELVHVATELAKDLERSADHVDLTTYEKTDQPKVSKKHFKPVPDEIDLHAEDLFDDFSSMTNTQIIRVQLAHFQEKLEEAIQMRKKSFVVIHGVGKGVLKEGVRDILKDYSSVKFADASYEVYGYGATEVIIE